ncbi:hypothetical protein [Pandoraea sp. ISTKB]|uniref:hypothetical protein n=1 Tax=Pandoraea sp. ISTKB TaxID=1586708 RepID=UPI000847B1C1|nr:hypothetical protein [Pandoraea sp. ISTKB]ODP31777.1 hypothetical protein A9762_25405 [Pandoraea sp. ISTKB]
MSTAPLSLIGHVPRSLDAETVKACATAGSDSQIATLWERIKDWFFGTHKVDAKLAIYQMANAQTAYEQLGAFIRLTHYVELQHFHQLQWCVDKDSQLSFKIGDHAFASNAQWASQMPLMLDMEDMSRLLLSLRYDGLDVADAFRELGVKRLHEAAASAAASGSGQAVDINADSLLTMQQQYLREAPVLLAALEIIGLHRNDYEGDMAYRLRQTMEALKESTSVDRDDDMAAIVGRNAESLMSLVTALFHERERDKRASQRGYFAAGFSTTTSRKWA